MAGLTRAPHRAPAAAVSETRSGGHSARPAGLGPGASGARHIVDAERQLLALEEALCAARVPSESAGAHPLSNSTDAPVTSFARLEAALSEIPTRYAPFFALAAELFDLGEDAVRAELARLRAPRVWSFAGLPGIAQVPVRGGPRVAAAETLFVRFAPGLRFPAHRHTGLERVLVLEGSYEDDGGVLHRAGELREWSAGTGHSFRVSPTEPCIIASVVFGRRFDAWPLRALSALLGR